MQPIFILRGHQGPKQSLSGVTAVTNWHTDDHRELVISGDEHGSVILWDIASFRSICKLQNVLVSQVQSIKVIYLTIRCDKQYVLVAQSRNDGVFLLNLTKLILNPETIYCSESCEQFIVDRLTTCQALYSRGDAISVNNEHAVLAYPSSDDSHLTTVRFVGEDAKTLISGTAKRTSSDREKAAIVFDIKIVDNKKSYNIYAAYEDGILCVYHANINDTAAVPVLNATGLNITILHKIDPGFQDFISAFDLIWSQTTQQASIVCGSPHKELVWISCTIDEVVKDIKLDRVKLKRQGVSSIAISPVCNIVAVAQWDKSVEIYSLDELNLLGSLTNLNHSKQVQALTFVQKSSFPEDSDQFKLLLCCASLDGTLSIVDMKTNRQTNWQYQPGY